MKDNTKNIIQHNGAPCVEARVHMLATDEHTGIWFTEEEEVDKDERLFHTLGGLDNFYNQLPYGVNDIQEAEGRGYKPQHLYITTDGEIKNGEPCIVDDGFGRIAVDIFYTSIKYSVAPRKIIATTDPKLINNGLKSDTKTLMPQIAEKFIEEYCKVKYCKVNGIDEVLIEYEDIWKSSTYDQPDKYIDRKLKLNSNNEITIHLVGEKIYTETELKDFATYMLDGDFSEYSPEECINMWINKK